MLGHNLTELNMAFSETGQAYDLIDSCERFLHSLKEYPNLKDDIRYVTDRLSYAKRSPEFENFPSDLLVRIKKVEQDLENLKDNHVDDYSPYRDYDHGDLTYSGRKIPDVY